MKKGWTYKRLGEVATFMSGYTPEKQDLQCSGSFPYFKVAEMNLDGNELYMRNTSLFVKSPKKIFPKGSIIFPKNGGAVYTEKKRILDCDSVIDLNTEALTPNSEVCLMYLFYYLCYIKISSFDKGGGLPSLDIKKMSNSLIPITSILEQQRIVERLDAAFENIEKLKANAEKQLAEAQTLFQKSLAKAMEPKEGWEEKTLSEITEVKDGTHDSPKYVTEGIPFVTQKNITINGFDLINTKKITLEDHKKFYTRSNVEYGDIIIAMIGANRGMSCIVNTREIFSIKNVGLIKKTENINMGYLLYYLHSPVANSYVLENSNGGAQEFIGLKGLRNFPIQHPPLAEQQRIVERLDALSENIRKYEEIQRQIISECDALKQALLRKVFE